MRHKGRNGVIWEQRLIEATHDFVFTTHMKSILLDEVPHTHSLHIELSHKKEKSRAFRFGI